MLLSFFQFNQQGYIWVGLHIVFTGKKNVIDAMTFIFITSI